MSKDAPYFWDFLGQTILISWTYMWIAFQHLYTQTLINNS